ncbi:50S ribosomal protein L18 [Desulfatiferula olefinivorans]
MSNLSKNEKRLKRKIRIRKKVTGTSERPRLCVFRSTKHIYAQIIDDTAGKTLVSASTVEKDFVKNGDKKACANSIGQLVAKRALDHGIKKIVFDRNGYIYHGRLKALSDGAREAGLEF